MKFFPLLVGSFLAACAPATQGPPAASTATPGTSASLAATTPHLREERAKATLDRIAAKDFEGAREWFDGPMRDQISAQALRDTWLQTEANLGPYQSHTFNGAMRAQGVVKLEYSLVFEKGHLIAHVTFDDDGMIAGLYIKPQAQ